MANSGVPQFPQPGQYRSDTSQIHRVGHERNAIGQLEQAPGEIRTELTERRQAIRARGEVTRVDRDGGVRIATPQGNVDVQLPSDQPRPQTGQHVEVEITPPPRDAAQQTAEVVIRPAPQTTEIAQPSRTSTTPIDIQVGKTQTARADAQIIRPENIDPNAPPPRNSFPEAGSLVRLDPITPAQLEQLGEARQLVTADTARNVAALPPASDALPPQNGAASITAAVTPLNAAPLNTQAINLTSANTAQPQIQTQTQLQTQAQTVLPQVISTLNTPPVTDGEATLNVQILSRAQAAVAQLQSAASGSTTPAPPPLAAQDARIGSIQSPQITLNPPNANLGQSIDQSGIHSTINGTNNAAQISGVVIAKTEAQIPIVQFSIPQNGQQAITTGAPLTPAQQQTYTLKFPSDALILGSRIDVTPQSLLTSTTSSASPTALTQSLPALPFANIAFAQAWPLMQDIQQTLTQQATAQGAQAAAQSAQAFGATIPSPANATQFAPAALFFVAAMRGGDMGSWLGDKASEILRSEGKGSLISQIGSESATLPRGADAPSGEWKGMNIPLMWEGDIQKIALHYKHDSNSDSEDSKQSGNKGTRFIFDLDLDVMGKVQLDGFFRPVSENGPRLDIVLRTEERFSGAMQAEMRRVYMDAIKPSQVGGELSFQDGIGAWVMIDAQGEREVGVSA